MEQFAEGEIPRVTLQGPYTYAQTTIKEGITFSSEGTIRFTAKDQYVFMPELSNGTESDNVTVEVSKWIPVSPYVGIITNGNTSFGENFTINDGVSDIEKLGKVVAYNDEVSLNIWRTEQANQINGSDGSLFPPFRKEGVTEYVFSGDICRSLEFESRGIDYVHGVPTINFQLSEKVLLSADANPANRGFCVDYPKCPKSGVLDMSTCKPNTPIVMSLPHFNQVFRFPKVH
ncbi:unnamed protein product [Dibothriocephalus latus]|uniref:Uncharacterized protein n=1 Tax=Dibothriocephalus latus TaxID=60516 RepID=A0A3P7LV61_DIBLA|nr:unnamed protein product [Dibothriocephalus latus]